MSAACQRFSRSWFEDAIARNFIVVARITDASPDSVAFTPRETQAHMPDSSRKCFARFPQPETAYIHGPGL